VADPFAIASELAQLGGLSVPDDLARWQMVLELASAEIRDYSGQVLSEVTGDVVVFEPEWSQTLYLPERPVTAVTQVLVEGVATTDYRLLDERKIVRGSDPNVLTSLSWSRGATVTYNHGYAEMTESYKSVKAICLEVADRALRSPEAPSSFEPSEETIGWRARIFLDEQQKSVLANLGVVAVG
jgi:hypothetical protein